MVRKPSEASCEPESQAPPLRLVRLSGGEPAQPVTLADGGRRKEPTKVHVPMPENSGSAVDFQLNRELLREGNCREWDRAVLLLQREIGAYFERRFREDWEDLVSETFERAYRYHRSYDPARPFRAWLFAIAKTRAATRFANEKRPALGIEFPGDDALAGHAQPGDIAEDVALRLDQEAAVAQLTADQRTAFQLREQGMKFAEIAEMTGKSEGAVKMDVSRAKKRLRELLE